MTEPIKLEVKISKKCNICTKILNGDDNDILIHILKIHNSEFNRWFSGKFLSVEVEAK